MSEVRAHYSMISRALGEVEEVLNEFYDSTTFLLYFITALKASNLGHLGSLDPAQ